MWLFLNDYIMRSGHAYVEIGSNITGINNFVKPSNPARYASLNMPASMNLPPNTGAVFGHVLGIMAQGGALLKANPAGGPFNGFNVRNVILAGCSEQGLVIRQYMRDAHWRLEHHRRSVCVRLRVGPAAGEDAMRWTRDDLHRSEADRRVAVRLAPGVEGRGASSSTTPR
jgi:hypothetical protein